MAKKLFISQPMNGFTDEQILEARNNAIEIVKERVNDEIELIDTFYEFNGKPLEYLGRAISDMANADVAYFGEGWEKARGCKIEHECALQYGIDVIHYR